MKHRTKQLTSKFGDRAIQFFYYLSNTDPLLKERASHWGRAKALLVGVLIMLSSSLAGLSMYYFVYSAIESFWAALIFALLWLLTVAHIEKSVYLSSSKWAVIVRIMMIMVISFLVNIPLKIALFSDALSDQVKEMQHAQKVANYSDVANQQAQASGMQHQLNGELRQLQDQRNALARKREAEAGGLNMYGSSGQAGKGAKYKALNKQVEYMDQAIKNKQAQIDKAERQSVQDATRAQQMYALKNEGITQSDSFFYRYKGYKRMLTSSDPLTRETTAELSIIIYLVLIIIELSPVLLKSLLPVTDMDREAIKGQQLLELTQDYRNETMAKRVSHIGAPDFSDETDADYRKRIHKYSQAITDISTTYRHVV